MKKAWPKKYKIILIWVIIVGSAAIASLVWTYACETDAHHRPSPEWVDIHDILKKEVWTDSDYALLEEQTGLSTIALCALKEEGRTQELSSLQEAYYRKVTVKCEPNTVISREEYLVDEAGMLTYGMPIPYVEDGDILITNCSHALGWRNGHAGMVIDAKEGLVLEAQVMGCPTAVTSLKRWESYPSFLILRLDGADAQERAQIAAYAKEKLQGIPYRLEAGLWNRALGKWKESDLPSGTQCAHLIWYAYYRFGYDLDSDGGLIVTPKDIAESEKLVVIQKYGI